MRIVGSKYRVAVVAALVVMVAGLAWWWTSPWTSLPIVTRWRPSTNSGWPMAWSPDNRVLVLGGWTGAAIFHDLETGAERRIALDFPLARSATFSPDGQTLAVFGGVSGMPDQAEVVIVDAAGDSGILARLDIAEGLRGDGQEFVECWDLDFIDCGTTLRILASDRREFGKIALQAWDWRAGRRIDTIRLDPPVTTPGWAYGSGPAASNSPHPGTWKTSRISGSGTCRT